MRVLVLQAAVNTAAINAVASTWFAGWHGGEGMFTPSNVSWSKYTSVAYAFAETTPNISDLNITAEEVPILRELVTLGHQNVRSAFCIAHIRRLMTVTVVRT